MDNMASTNTSNVIKTKRPKLRASIPIYLLLAPGILFPLRTITPANGMKIGFDVMVNDAWDGARKSLALWNDDQYGSGWQDTSVFGELTLID